jgi:hypothetical protein
MASKRTAAAHDNCDSAEVSTPKETRKRACVFKPDFAKKWPELTQGRKGESFAFYA